MSHFKVENMGTAMKRGMVLTIYRSKIKEVSGHRLAKVTGHAKMVGPFENPTLIIYCKIDIARYELTMQRHKIKQAINERIKADLIQKIIFK